MRNRLHLYGQSYAHDPAFIVADTKSLEALHNAIELALKERVASVTVFDEIGEGFELTVVLNEDDEMQLPYDIDAANPVGLGPYDLVKFDRASQKFRPREVHAMPSSPALRNLTDDE